jgi:hypothetical protein
MLPSVHLDELARLDHRDRLAITARARLLDAARAGSACPDAAASPW